MRYQITETGYLCINEGETYAEIIYDKALYTVKLMKPIDSDYAGFISQWAYCQLDFTEIEVELIVTENSVIVFNDKLSTIENTELLEYLNENDILFSKPTKIKVTYGGWHKSKDKSIISLEVL